MRRAVRVKWPNDVLHSGRKVCGVLAESRVSGARLPLPPTVVIGAGVNVNQSEADFPVELRDRATSLRIAGGGRSLSTDDVLAAILRRFERYLALASGGDATDLWTAVTSRLPKPGTEVSLLSGGRRINGTVEGITESGALRIRELGQAEVTVVSAGEMA